MAKKWTEWGEHVFAEIERHDAAIEDIRDEQVAQRMEIVRLQVKAGVWGALAGMIPGVAAVVWWMLQR